MPEKRKHLVQSAEYWFTESRRERDENGNHFAALQCMENAYNHVENELAGCRQSRKELLDTANAMLEWLEEFYPDEQLLNGGPDEENVTVIALRKAIADATK